MTITLEDLAARITTLEARADEHCTTARPCKACVAARGLRAQSEMFANIAREAQRREALERQKKIDAAAANPRVKIKPRGFVRVTLPDERQGRVLRIALDKTGRDGGTAMYPLLSSWQAGLVELPELAQLCASGELIAEPATLAEQVAAQRTHLDDWAAAR